MNANAAKPDFPLRAAGARRPGARGKTFPHAETHAKRNLFAYYSSGGAAEDFAREIFSDSDGDFAEIRPKFPYPCECGSRLSALLAEIRSGLLPEICDLPNGIAQYENVYMLCPTCLGFVPPPVKSFLCAYDFSGKILRLFCMCAPARPREFALSVCALCPGASVEIFCARGNRARAGCPFAFRPHP